LIGLLLALLLSAWIGGMAILSVQNADPVSIKFLLFQSIQMPVGVALALAVSGGLLAVVLIRPLWRLTASRRPKKAKLTS
jgi:uncharacterized integral membrane protein